MTYRTPKLAARLKGTGPVVANRAGILLMLTADTLAVGWRLPDAFAPLGLAIAVQALPAVVAIAYMQASLVSVAQARGAGERARLPAIWRASLVHALAFGLAGAGVCLLGPAFLRAIGTAAPLAEGAGAVLPAYAWGLPGLALFLAASYRLDGGGRPVPGMVAILAANAINLALSLALAGEGADRVAHVTSAMRWAMGAGLILYIYGSGCEKFRLADFALPRTLPFQTRQMAEAPPRLARLAAPIALAQLVETTAFTAIVPLAGLLGAGPAGAYHAALQMVQIAYMGTLGVSAAAAVEVGRAAGAGARGSAARAARAGLWLAGLLALPAALTLFLAPEWVAGLLVRDPETLAHARLPMRLAAGVVLLDAAMGVLLGSLRGLCDVWTPLKLHILAFWVVAIPLSAALAQDPSWAPSEPILGILAGLAVSVLLLGRRLAHILGRPGAS